MRVLKLLILGVGMTQEAVARESGITPKHLSQVLLGRASMSEKTSAALGAALGVPPEVLWLAQYVERAEQRAGDAEPGWERSSA